MHGCSQCESLYLNKMNMIHYESEKTYELYLFRNVVLLLDMGGGEWNLNNSRDIQDISMKYTPFFYILEELSNDTKYIPVGLTKRWIFPRIFRFFPYFRNCVKKVLISVIAAAIPWMRKTLPSDFNHLSSLCILMHFNRWQEYIIDMIWIW